MRLVEKINGDILGIYGDSYEKLFTFIFLKEGDLYSYIADKFEVNVDCFVSVNRKVKQTVKNGSIKYICL